VKSGVKELSRRVKEVDYMTVDEEAWVTLAVPERVALPLVNGESVV
jgi:hypothetical protein